MIGIVATDMAEQAVNFMLVTSCLSAISPLGEDHIENCNNGLSSYGF